MISISKYRAINILRALGSETYQRLAWFENPARIYFPFGEMYEQLYNDCGLSKALDKGISIFGTEADSQLKILDRLCYKFDHYRAEDELIVDPDMIEIRSQARLCLDLVLASSPNDADPKIVFTLDRDPLRQAESEALSNMPGAYVEDIVL